MNLEAAAAASLNLAQNAAVLASQTSAAAQISAAQIVAAASIFGACAGFVGTLTSVLANRWLEHLKADLSDRQSERKAKLDYEYEARKKLYSRCEPAAFRFVRECELSRNRILLLHSLANAGELPGWLEIDDNRVSTIYRLFAPIATYYQINSLLTSYDLSLAPRLHAIYGLGRLLRDAFVSDKQIAGAASGAPLDYQPEKDGGTDPAVHQRQGITYEELDTLVMAMTTETGILQLPAFAKLYNDVDSPIRKAANGVDHVVRDLDPTTLPVLWRLYFYNLAVTTLLCDLMHRAPNDADFSARRFLDSGEAEQSEWASGAGRPVLAALEPQLRRVAAELRINIDRRLKRGS
ncbi:hypothetical protein [Sphingomonas sp. 35-24ZXX]|uniref:hypothetical protein n=1 Tax=Sphingomonas sp. 35-24ZXX TaxID=1545915 RepID=UPI00053BE321|nr:hypothetical protein [Sphingomonas sp. 35-24ZXX]